MTKERMIERLSQILVDEKDLQILEDLINSQRFDSQMREIDRDLILKRDAEKEVGR